MNGLHLTFRATLLAARRDRVLYAVFGVALASLVLVPVLSLFSLRQVPQLAMTLALSTTSLTLLLLTVMLGGFSIWRDVERRYTASLLGLPVARSRYLAGKFLGVAVLLAGSGLVFILVSTVVVQVACYLYPPDEPVAWGTFLLAVLADVCKYTLLTAWALLFSALSTSFFLPVFGTLAVFLVGNASQEVMDFVTGPHGEKLSELLRLLVRSLYYIVPNFAVFDFHVEAVYGLPVAGGDLLLAGAYFVCYTGLVLLLAAAAFQRRELP